MTRNHPYWVGILVVVLTERWAHEFSHGAKNHPHLCQHRGCLGKAGTGSLGPVYIPGQRDVCWLLCRLVTL